MTTSLSSRRRSLGLATGALSTLLALALTGSVLSPAIAAPGNGNGGGKNATTPAPATTATALGCHTLPDAAALPTERGRTINTLHPYQGRVYYGYGDYNANTGSMAEPYGMNVSSFDPATGTPRVHFTGFKTEEIHVFRTIGDHLYVPNIDPSRGADFYNSYASNAGEQTVGAAPGTWAENPGAHASVHVYDVTKAGGDLFVAGSSEWSNATDGAAIIWRSADNGATWVRSMEETEDDPAMRNGFERYYWMGVIGDKVYTRAALNLAWPEVAPLRVYDTATGTWSTVAEGSDSTRFGTYVYEANEVVSWRNRLWSANGGLMWFDGSRTVRVGGTKRSSAPNIATLAIGDDRLLYGADHDGGVYRIGDGTTSTRKGKGRKQASGLTFTKVGSIASGVRPFTVANAQIWAAADYGTAQVCSYRLG